MRIRSFRPTNSQCKPPLSVRIFGRKSSIRSKMTLAKSQSSTMQRSEFLVSGSCTSPRRPTLTSAVWKRASSERSIILLHSFDDSTPSIVEHTLWASRSSGSSTFDEKNPFEDDFHSHVFRRYNQPEKSKLNNRFYVFRVRVRWVLRVLISSCRLVEQNY